MAKSTTTKDHQQGIDGGRLEITSGVALAQAVGFEDKGVSVPLVFAACTGRLSAAMAIHLD